MAVRLERFGERHHSVADVVMVLAAVCLALVSWSYLGDAASVPLWKPYASVALVVLLTLAALTRQPHWAISIRLLTGGWMIAAPYLLKFADIAPALWAYLTIGVLLATIASISGNTHCDLTYRIRLPRCGRWNFQHSNTWDGGSDQLRAGNSAQQKWPAKHRI